TEACDKIGTTRSIRQNAGELAQRVVSHQVREAVVDGFEVVDVDVYQSQWFLVADGTNHQHVSLVAEEAATVETGKFIADAELVCVVQHAVQLRQCPLRVGHQLTNLVAVGIGQVGGIVRVGEVVYRAADGVDRFGVSLQHDYRGNGSEDR